MQSTRRNVEITLHRIHVPVTGTGLDTDTSHLLTAELIWPRVGIAKKTASQKCRLQQGQGDFESDNWGRRILFKETVEGHFALSLSLTENLDTEELEKALRFCAGALLSVGADAVEDAAGPVGDAAAAPLTYAAKQIAKYPGAKSVAEGMAELDTADFPTGGMSQFLTVQMLAVRDMFRIRRHAGRGGAARVTRKRLLKKGDPDGEITLAIRFLD